MAHNRFYLQSSGKPPKLRSGLMGSHSGSTSSGDSILKAAHHLDENASSDAKSATPSTPTAPPQTAAPSAADSEATTANEPVSEPTAGPSDAGPSSNQSTVPYNGGSIDRSPNISPKPSANGLKSEGANGPATTPTSKTSPFGGSMAAGPQKPANAAPKGALGGKSGTRPARAVANYLRKHPRGVIIAVISVITALISAAVWLISIPFQMIHMAEQLLLRFQPNENIEQRGERRLMSRVFTERAATKAPAEGAIKDTNTGHPIKDMLNNIANNRISNFNQLLAKDNLKLEFDSGGKLTGIRNTLTGELSQDFSESTFQERRVGIGKVVAERIAPWRVLKRIKYTKLMRFHARVSWEFWPKEKVNDIKKLLTEKIRGGASAEEILKATGKNPDGSPNTTGVESQNNDVAQATADEYNKTGSKTAAIKKGIDTFNAKAGRTLGISGMIAMACSIFSMINDYTANGYIDRAVQLIRNGNVILTFASQLRTGKNLNLDEFGKTMDQLNGDPKAPAKSVNRKGWDQSASYRRINKLPIVTAASSSAFNPDLNPASNPNGAGLINTVNGVIQSIMSKIPGSQYICAAANSTIGTALLIIGGVSEVIANIADGELLEVGITAAKLALQYELTEKVLPWLLSAATNLAITGTENSTDFFNNADAGALMSAMDYGRSYGGRRLSKAEHQQLTVDAEQINRQIAQDKGLGYQLFALANPQSLISKVVDKVPSSPQAAVADIVSLPNSVISSIGDILSGRAAQAADAVVDSNPYNFATYGFTKEEIDKYDPVENEDYLTQPIEGTDKTRLSVLGDPSTWTPDNLQDDPNSGDLMHCFVNVFRSPDDLAKDDICKGIGSVTNQDDNDGNPDDDVVAKIYKDNDLVIPIDDDFLRYRLQMFYTHGAQGLNCISTPLADCLRGSGGASAVATTGITGNWESGSSGEQTASGAFGTWRGTPDQIAGTWSVEALAPGGEYDAWKGDIDLGIVGMVENWQNTANGGARSTWDGDLSVVQGWLSRHPGKTVYMRFAYEGNGGFMGYDYTGSVSQFVSSFQAWANLCHAVAGCKTVWAMNDGGPIDARTAFPGAQYVDVIGVDSYNAYPFLNDAAGIAAKFKQTGVGGGPLGLDTWLAYAKSVGKPLAIPEWASCGTPGDCGPSGGDGDQYIQFFHDWLATNGGSGPGQVKYDIFFNVAGFGPQYYILPEHSSQANAAIKYKSLKWGNQTAATATITAPTASADDTSTKAPWWNLPATFTGWAMDFVRNQSEGALDF